MDQVTMKAFIKQIAEMPIWGECDDDGLVEYDGYSDDATFRYESVIQQARNIIKGTN